MARPRRSAAPAEPAEPVSPRRPRRTASALAETSLAEEDFVGEESGDDEYNEEEDEDEEEGTGAVEGDDDDEEADETNLDDTTNGAEEKEGDEEELKLDNDNVDDDPDEEEPEEPVVPVRRGRGRPPGSKNKTTLARERMGLIPVQPVRRRGPPKRRRDDDEEGGTRGRKKRGKPSHLRKGQLLDDDGKPMVVEDDEIITPDDPKGEEKVDKQGALLGGRQYKIRTFTCMNRKDKLFMLSTEPARCMGFRDSYLLFQKHKRLLKIIIDDAEKMDLIEREILPHSYKGRTIGLVSARSVFKEFGARIVINGKKVTDDYYEEKARAEGAIEGELADPVEDPSKRQMIGGVPGDKRYFTNIVPDQSWMFEHASAARQFDSMLLYDRNLLFVPKGVRNAYTGVNFLPASTQPARVVIKKVVDEKETEDQKRKLTIETVITQSNSIITTGLKDVPLEVFEDCVSPEVKAAILKQQELERSRF
ncbi:unnamed protein product [Kuraishia capsulata CBS 1993]|uniref:Chromatin structure-remodeling complex protein RSC7 n=1 Tax=Kuraishia capsulata CBS 1993 TaxID=1382522 RepID=W6ML91_9ASCO|nr:uncharacterized protein KUCA_T00003237001 [Kuraishia capsulata CBS 1993]CDK27259.1 unnamed protein product [Kuraishia capsulata CBS 1993]